MNSVELNSCYVIEHILSSCAPEDDTEFMAKLRAEVAANGIDSIDVHLAMDEGTTNKH